MGGGERQRLEMHTCARRTCWVPTVSRATDEADEADGAALDRGVAAGGMVNWSGRAMPGGQMMGAGRITIMHVWSCYQHSPQRHTVAPGRARV